MNFKYKAFIQKKLSLLPYAENLNFFFQKNITKTLPIPEDEFLEKMKTVEVHFINFMNHSRTANPEECTYFEFGTGYDLVIPVCISLNGFKKLYCVDIRKLLFPELIESTFSRLQKFSHKIKLSKLLPDDIPEVTNKNYKEILYKYLRITYVAPSDARKTSLDSDSIDFILSNATMEHIPETDLKDILKECYRIMKPGGIMSNIIDYRDHFSFFDNSISVYNFLQYSQKEWDKLNPSIMFQNRLRHREYIRIINDIGFEIIEEKKSEAEKHEMEQLRGINLNKYFKENYSFEELGIKASTLVLRKN